MRTTKTSIQKKKIGELYQKGCQYLSDLNFHDAISQFNEVLKTNRKHQGALMNKGLALLLRDDDDISQAIDCFQTVLEHYGQSWEVQWCLGIIFSRIGETKYTKDAFGTVTEEYQKLSDQEKSLSVIESLLPNLEVFQLLIDHKYDDAIEKAQLLNPKNIAGINWDAYLLQAYAHIGKCELQEASNCLTHVIDRCSSNLNAVSLMSTIHMLQGNLLSAAEVLEKDLKIEAERELLVRAIKQWCDEKYSNAIAILSRFSLLVIPISLRSYQYRLNLLQNILHQEPSTISINENQKHNNKMDENDDINSNDDLFRADDGLTIYEKVQLQQLQILNLMRQNQHEKAKSMLDKLYSLTRSHRNPLLNAYGQFEQCVIAHAVGLTVTSNTRFCNLIEEFEYNNAFKYSAKIYSSKQSEWETTFLLLNGSTSDRIPYELTSEIKSYYLTNPETVNHEESLLCSIENDIDDEEKLIRAVDENETTRTTCEQLEIDIIKLRGEISIIGQQIKAYEDEIKSKKQRGNQIFDQNLIRNLHEKLHHLQSTQSILWMRYERKKTKARQTSEFSRDKRLRNHFYHIQLKIEKIILGCKSGASGLVSKSSMSLSHVVNPNPDLDYKPYLVKGIKGVFDYLKNLPVVGNVTQALSKCIELISEIRKHNEFESFANAIPLRTCLIAAQELAFNLTKCYETQLLMIRKTKYEKTRVTQLEKFKGHLAKGADKFKKTVLKQDPTSYVNYLAEYGALIVLNSIFNLQKPKEDTNPHAWARFWMEKIKFGYNSDEDSVLGLFYKMVKNPNMIVTESEKSWDIRHIYCKTGIDIGGEIYGHSVDDIDLYGTREGTKDEAEKLKMHYITHSKPEIQSSSLVKSKSSKQMQNVSRSQFTNININSENTLRKVDDLERRLKTMEIRMRQLVGHQRTTPDQLMGKLSEVCGDNVGVLRISLEGNLIKFGLVEQHRHRHQLLNKIATELSYLNETSDCEMNHRKESIKWKIRSTHLARHFYDTLSKSINVEDTLDNHNNYTHHHSRTHRRRK